MVQATNQDPAENNSASIEEDDHAVPDVELLAFQKQRSTPKVSLSGIGADGQEEQYVEIDDFADCADKGEAHYGMMQAGGEEKIVKELIRAGSLDPDGLPIGDASPGLKMKADILQNNEEEKR